MLPTAMHCGNPLGVYVDVHLMMQPCFGLRQPDRFIFPGEDACTPTCSSSLRIRPQMQQSEGLETPNELFYEL